MATVSPSSKRPLPMESLTAIERQWKFKLPPTYCAFAERGYLNFSGDAYLWVNDAEWIPPSEILNYEWSGTQKLGLVPFAFTGGGDVWAWQTQRILSTNEPAIAFCPRDDYQGHWHAPSFIGWLYRIGLEYASLGWDEEPETRNNLTSWSRVVREFGDATWAADLEEISRRPLQKYRVGRYDADGLLPLNELRDRVASAFGGEFVDSPYVWDNEGDAAAD